MMLRKMLRDLKKNGTQFISIFLMIFMGVFIYSGLNAVGQGMDQCSKKFYENTNLADAFVYGENFTKEEVNRLEQETSIIRVERRIQADATLGLKTETTLQLNFVESNTISANHITTGEPFDPMKKGIWLDSSFADANSIKVGDSIDLVIGGQTISPKIMGLIMNPEYVYALKEDNEVIPNHKTYGYAFLSANEFGSGLEVPFNELLIETNASKNSLESMKNKIFKDKQTVLVMRQDHQSVNMFMNEVNQMKAMQAIFPIVFLLIAILTTLTTMTRITISQRTQIGTFKAIGFSNKKILIHFISYGTFIGTLGGTLGLITGPILLPSLMFQFQKGFYSMPEWKGSIEPTVFLVAILCITGCALSGFMACRKELHGAAAEILRPKAPKISKHTGLEKSKWWNAMKFDLQWNIRDVLRNRVRSFITIIGIIGCMALIICALGMRDTVRGMTNISYKELNAYATKITLDESISMERLLDLKEDKKLQFIQETAIEIDMENEKETTMLTVIGEGSYIKHKDNDNNFITLPKDGIAITNKFAKLHNLKIGERLKWRIYGSNTWIIGEIKTIVRNPISQGIFVSEEAYKALDQTMLPTAFVTNEDSSNYTGEEFSFIQTSEELLNSMDTLMETMNAMIVILIMAAILLGVVVLYNLGVLSFNERIRELTTLKVLGFQYEKLRKLLQMQNVWLTLLGTFLGAPSGYLLLSYMLKFMGDSFDMLPSVSVYSLVCSVLGTLLLSVVVNWFLCLKIKTIDMVSALKSVE